MQNPNPFTNIIEPLPVDSISAVLLLDLFRDPDRDIDSIVEFISNDPLLTAETLRRCNLASFRGSERVSDIFEAVSRLGFYELYDIIATSVDTGATVVDARRIAELEGLRHLPQLTMQTR